MPSRAARGHDCFGRLRNGPRLLVDVTIMDDSGTKGDARCKFPAWFPKTLTNAPSDDLALLMDAAKKKEPVAFFNLVVLKAENESNDNKKTTLKTSKDKFVFHKSTDNERADRLKQNAEVIAGSTDITVVAELPTFESTPIDYVSMESTFTVCRLLAYVIQAGGSLMTPNSNGGGASEHGVRIQGRHACTSDRPRSATRQRCPGRRPARRAVLRADVASSAPGRRGGLCWRSP